jgi:hypothetical protein
MYRDTMDGEAATGRVGRAGAAVAGSGATAAVAAGSAGAEVAGRGPAVFVTAGTAGAAGAVGKTTRVGMAGAAELQATTVSRTTIVPSRTLNCRERIKDSFV